eukprot:3407410-Pyramimonas_sp.AAC.1
MLRSRISRCKCRLGCFAARARRSVGGRSTPTTLARPATNWSPRYLLDKIWAQLRTLGPGTSGPTRA